jgi:hypothetical protein
MGARLRLTYGGFFHRLGVTRSLWNVQAAAQRSNVQWGCDLCRHSPGVTCLFSVLDQPMVAPRSKRSRRIFPSRAKGSVAETLSAEYDKGEHRCLVYCSGFQQLSSIFVMLPCKQFMGTGRHLGTDQGQIPESSPAASRAPFSTITNDVSTCAFLLSRILKKGRRGSSRILGGVHSVPLPSYPCGECSSQHTPNW